MKIILAITTTLISNISLAEEVAFIGAPYAVQRSDKSCRDYIDQPDPSSGEEVVCMDRAFLLKYEVESILVGKADGKFVDFIGFYHYWGMPNYLSYEPALVILTTERGYLQLRYIKSVHEEDTGWFVCKKWSEDDGCLYKQSAISVARKVLEKI